MKKLIIDGHRLIQKTIKYYAVEGNPNHKVWGASKKEAQALAPKGANLVLLRSEKILIED